MEPAFDGDDVKTLNEVDLPDADDVDEEENSDAESDDEREGSPVGDVVSSSTESAATINAASDVPNSSRSSCKLIKSTASPKSSTKPTMKAARGHKTNQLLKTSSGTFTVISQSGEAHHLRLLHPTLSHIVIPFAVKLN